MARARVKIQSSDVARDVTVVFSESLAGEKRQAASGEARGKRRELPSLAYLELPSFLLGAHRALIARARHGVAA
jgi:hypothetical protein